MSDYISREDAMDAWYTNERYTDIEGIPSADVVERKHGKWKKAYLDHESFGVRPTVVYCSECNLVGYWEPNFCPNCGARMVNDDV